MARIPTELAQYLNIIRVYLEAEQELERTGKENTKK